MFEEVDIREIQNLKVSTYQPESKESLTEGIEDLQDPRVSVKDIEEELGRKLADDFYNQPTDEALYGDSQKEAVIKYPLLLINNIGCPEILEEISNFIDEITVDDSIIGGFINVYYADDQGQVRFLGYKKLNTDIFLQMKSFLCKPTYYVSKGVIKDINYEDFIDFEKMKPKIVVTEDMMISYKDKTNPFRNYQIAKEAEEDIIKFQLDALERFQIQDKAEVSSKTISNDIMNDYFSSSRFKTTTQPVKENTADQSPRSNSKPTTQEHKKIQETMPKALSFN